MELRYQHSVLGTYEIENVSNGYLKEAANDFAYVDTSICYNNDYFLGHVLLAGNDHIKIISKIPPQMTDQYEFMIKNHLRCLGRKKIDIMLIHNPRAEWVELAKKLENDNRFSEVGVSNFSIDDLRRYKEELGHYPKYNEMEINPDYYNKELIDFCHLNSIKIIAYAILGGKYNARRNISQYTLPYLLMLAGKNAEFVIVRSDNYYRVSSMKEFLDKANMIEADEKLFDLDQTDNKSIIPDKYKFPSYYTRVIFPTNSDKVYITKYLALTRGFMPSDDVQDDLRLLETVEDLNYEFISDYRVYLRYEVDNILYKKTGKYPTLCSYIYPSTYTAGYVKTTYDKVTGKKYPYIIVSTNILMNDGNLNKVNDNKGKLIVESILKEF